VPKYTVVLRKAFGGAYITMNSRELGADLTLAWTRAQLGIMGARQAVGIVHRRELEAADDADRLRQRLADDYGARHLGAQMAARGGYVDEVVLPSHTRDRLAWALTTVPNGRGGRGTVRNLPL
jgi:acetyl-CoA carboxylase carboxyltransferase component